MPNSPTSTAEISANCLTCGRSFKTAEIRLFGHTFVADRYCEFCREAEIVLDDERRAELRWGQAEVPPLYRRCSFANFERVEGTERALGVARQWTKDFRTGTKVRRGLGFYGHPGAGKTHLAVAVLREAAWSERASRCLFLNVPEWLNAIRESWNSSKSEPPPTPEGYEIVLLDDLGAEYWSDWARDRIYSLVNHREQEGSLTFLTSNCTAGELVQRVGRPTASRLGRLCAEVELEPKRDYREVLVERDPTQRSDEEAA